MCISLQQGEGGGGEHERRGDNRRALLYDVPDGSGCPQSVVNTLSHVSLANDPMCGGRRKRCVRRRDDSNLPKYASSGCVLCKSVNKREQLCSQRCDYYEHPLIPHAIFCEFDCLFGRHALTINVVIGGG